jgi:CheY-like chemotaxis protein
MSQSKIKVLLVDDEADLLRFGKMLLEGNGMSVTTVGDGASALQQFQSDSFDIIISDIRMPKMTGIQLLASIRKLNATIPVILCSTFSNDFRIVSDANTIQPNATFAKPFDPESMVKTIQDLVTATSQSPKKAS